MRPTTIVDLVLLVFVVEALLLLAARKRLRTPFAALLPNLAAGLFLVLALRSAVDGDSVPIAVFVALGGVAHATDLWLRLRR